MALHGKPVRQELLEQLRGQELRIPDLRRMFKHWPMDINTQLESIRASVPNRISSLTESAQKQRLLTKIDSGLFSSTWWPGATLADGDILSCLALWLFIWDDEMDAEVGDLSSDFQAAQTFRRETIEYVRHCLGLDEVGCGTREPPENKRYLEHRELLFRELEFFTKTSEVEEKRRLSPDLPSVEEYVETRMGTSAVNVTSFFNEYAYRVSLPIKLLTDPYMKVVWDKTNIIIWATNDLLSLKKEVGQQSVDSIVPLLFRQFGSLDLAVSMVVETIEKAVEDFDYAAYILTERYSGDESLIGNLKTYINACRLNCTGNLNWSLQTGRYGVSKHAIAGGVMMRLE
ncbi:Presilphiperfolan-8-beta-ol synthase [Colletotrichum siamense]|uniref:Presilphiperfolan-8-beta-ol synthase n=1 Tax=Colletotrichum siamense TaxID=690259 RepID=UPI001872DE60|nr:Presilphiperfolan-8-beta-ol synthase [Colletotrichum siamense]KAF5516045.1 Presilphiperfolan-8-beta-ol synthase [Colletotrichum siamense]